MSKYIQSGRNDRYPKKIIDTWRYQEPNIPTWITDISKVLNLTYDGKITIATRDLNTGGFEIIGSDGIIPIVSAKTKNDYICLGDDNKIFSLTETQINLLYTEEK